MSSLGGAPAPELVEEFRVKLAQLELVTIVRSGWWGINPRPDFEREASDILKQCYELLARIKGNGSAQSGEAKMCEDRLNAILFRAEQWGKSESDKAEH